VAIQNEREWRRFCAEILEDATLAEDPRFASTPARVANRAALDALIRARLADAPRAAGVARLEAAKIAYGRLSTLEDLERHPQNRLVTVTTSAGEIELLAPGALVAGAPAPGGRVPELGEDEAAIRAEFG
jgi:crotonobetainyl-CoA:carnitine CoA-transferase CaiB-like acyl-CoA transferase